MALKDARMPKAMGTCWRLLLHPSHRQDSWIIGRKSTKTISLSINRKGCMSGELLIGPRFAAGTAIFLVIPHILHSCLRAAAACFCRGITHSIIYSVVCAAGHGIQHESGLHGMPQGHPFALWYARAVHMSATDSPSSFCAVWSVNNSLPLSHPGRSVCNQAAPTTFLYVDIHLSYQQLAHMLFHKPEKSFSTKHVRRVFEWWTDSK